MWQDSVLAFSSMLFTIPLFIQIKRIYDFKNAKVMSYILIFLYIFSTGLTSFCFITLGLHMSAILCIIQSLCWITIIFQKLHYEKTKKSGSES